MGERMKRRQAEYLLAGLLSTMYETDQHPEKQLANAKTILDVLEDQGMKPPIKKKCPVLLTETHTWEPEDK